MSKLNKKRNFATDIDISGDTYAGIHAMPYVTAAVKSPDTVAKGYVRQLDGLTKSAVINNITASSPVKAAGCDWDNDTDIETTESLLTLTDYKVNEQICRGTVFPTWLGQGMNLNGDLPNSFSDFILSTVAGSVGQQLENGIWLGKLDGTNNSVGFVSNSGTLDAAGFAASACANFTTMETALTPHNGANTLLFFGEVYNSVAANVPGIMSKPGFGFFVGNQVYALYLQGLSQAGGAGYMNQVTNQGFQAPNYLGYPIYLCPGMPEKCIVATYKENLVYGTNNATDYTEVQLIPAYQYDGSDYVKVAMKFAVGVQCAVKTDGVIGYDLA